MPLEDSSRTPWRSSIAPVPSVPHPIPPPAMPLEDSIHHPDLPIVTGYSQMTPTFTPVKGSSSTSGWRKPNVVKVLIYGEDIKGDELDSYFG